MSDCQSVSCFETSLSRHQSSDDERETKMFAALMNSRGNFNRGLQSGQDVLVYKQEYHNLFSDKTFHSDWIYDDASIRIACVNTDPMNSGLEIF